MNQKIRSVLVVVIGFIAVLLLIAALVQGVIQPAFAELERSRALEDSSRATEAILREVRQLSNEVGDWANWDDSYTFVSAPNDAFIESNLSSWEVIEATPGFNLIAFYDMAGEVVFSEIYDSMLGGFLELDAFSGAPPPIQAQLAAVFDDQQTIAGIWPTEHGPLLLAAQPILTSEGSGPARGVVVFGRFLDQTLLQEFAAQTHVAFELFAPDDPRLAPAEEALLAQLLPGETRFQLYAPETLVIY